MDSQNWGNLLLLIAGGILTALGAWLNDLRSERRRKNAKLEEAYLTWLNTESAVIGRLKELTKLAEREPESLQSHNLLLEKFERLHSELQNLSSALNLAFVYERDRDKKALVEVSALLYAKLTETLRVIISHHKIHLEFHTTIDKVNALILRLEEMPESYAANSNVDIAETSVELYQAAQHIREKATDHLLTCSSELSADAKELSKKVVKIEEESPALRRALVE